MSKQKAKGTAAETALLKFLQDKGLLVVRNPLSGTKDKGDLTILAPHKIVIEVKNHRRMDLATWVDEAEAERVNAEAKIGVVAHKRMRKGNPADWYLTMTVNEFTELLNMLT